MRWLTPKHIESELDVGILGPIDTNFIRNYPSTIDYPGQNIYLSPYAALSHLALNEFIGVGFAMARIAGVWEIRLDR